MSDDDKRVYRTATMTLLPPVQVQAYGLSATSLSFHVLWHAHPTAILEVFDLGHEQAIEARRDTPSGLCWMLAKRFKDASLDPSANEADLLAAAYAFERAAMAIEDGVPS